MERQSLHKMKLSRLEMWSEDLGDHACVHERCTSARPASVTHHLWACRAAAWAWHALERLGATTGTDVATEAKLDVIHGILGPAIAVIHGLTPQLKLKLMCSRKTSMRA